MNHAAASKYVNILDPVSGTGAVTVDNVVDTEGYDYLTIVLSTGAAGAAATVFKAREGEASNMSDAADISGAVFGTSLDIDGGTSTLPTDSNDEIYVLNLDLRGRKRYIDVAVTRGATTLLSILGILSKGGEITNVLADRGVISMIDA